MKEGQRALLEKSVTSLVKKAECGQWQHQGFPCSYHPYHASCVLFSAYDLIEMIGDKLSDYCRVPGMIKFNFLLFIIHNQLKRLIQELMK